MKLRKKNIIIVLLVIAFISGIFFDSIILHANTMKKCSNKQATEKIDKAEKEDKEEKKQPINSKNTDDIKKHENIIFLGDSITDYYPIEEIFHDLPIINSGKAGYKTDDILEQMDEMVYQYNPTSVYILIGTNDFRDEDSDDLVEKVEGNIIEIVKQIKQHRKKAKIYIESIHPVNKSLNEKLVAHRDNDEIQQVNEFLKNYCREKKYTYIDIYNELTDSNGNYYKKYTDDGLHANTLGYARISQILTPYLYGIQI